MHVYEYINKPEELLTPEVVQMLGPRYLPKEKQRLLIHQALQSLRKVIC